MTVEGKVLWDEGPFQAQGQAASADLRYLLISNDPANDDRGDAYQWLFDNAPQDIFGLRLDGIHVSKRIREVNNAGIREAMWEGKTSYVNPSRKKPKPLPNPKEPRDKETPLTRITARSGPSIRSGGIGANTLYSRKFVEEVFGGASNEYKWENETAINRLLNLKPDVNDESAAMFVAEGIQITLGSTEFIVQTVIHDDDIRLDSYLVKAAELAGKNVVNKVQWKGFPPHSLKIINMDAKQRADDNLDPSLNLEPWDVVFTMAYSPEVLAADIKLPPGLEGRGPFLSNKRGWDYLDVLYIDDYYQTGAGVKFLVPQAVRASLHEIFEEADFKKELF